MEVTVEQVPAIQWFPGHMAKTRRLMKANLPYVDIVVELRDAKIPLSSGNPELASMIGNKKRVILLNKCDTADPAVTAQWIAWFKKKGIAAIAVDSRSGKGLNAFLPTVRSELSELLARRAEKKRIRSSNPNDGCRHPECREVVVYQPDGWGKTGTGRRPSRRNQRQAVGHRQQGCGIAGHARRTLAQI